MLSNKDLAKKNYGSLKENQSHMLQDVTRAHIESFNYFVKEGLEKVAQYLDPVEFYCDEDDKDPQALKISLDIKALSMKSPKVPPVNKYVGNSKVYPAECREGRKTYAGDLDAVVSVTCSNNHQCEIMKTVGQVPVMVKSSVCNLANLKPAALVDKGEEAEEMGGYFIVNGNEKVVRLIIQQKRNFPMCLERFSWRKRGPEYSEYGVSLRCVREDEAANQITLHYLQNGVANLAFGLEKEMFFVPIILVLKALLDVTDKHIFDALIQTREEDSFYKSSIVFMLRQVLQQKLFSQKDVLEFLGKSFRVKLSLPSWYSDEAVGKHLVRNSICGHLKDNRDKFNFLVYMTQKLFAFVNGECASESPDNPMFQEVLVPGHLIQMVLKEKLEQWMLVVKMMFQKVYKKRGKKDVLAIVRDCVRSAMPISRAMEYLLATGNIISKTGLGLMQNRGYAVIADKLNFFRYLSHFRAVHRGTFFTEMRTTSVRKLLPEAWGFLCPVHTPDGTPCGLLNHMTAACKVVSSEFPISKLVTLLMELGVLPCSAPSPWPVADCYTVLLDGRVIGLVNAWNVENLVSMLRILKVKGEGEVPPHLEVCLVKKTDVASQYPGLYLFSSIARLVRPVLNTNANAVEMIGMFEQVYLDIALNKNDFYQGVSTHQELCEQNMLSVLANMTPFSDFNQSPRNMYQCQMGKQTMGFPLQAYDHRADNKLYRIQTPQSPLVRPKMYEKYQMDEYPIGTNTIVAVISYTGYDMEDAMILNKSSYERGFAHGSIITSEVIDLRIINRNEGPKAFIFGCIPSDTTGSLDVDGLPPIGTRLKTGDPYFSYKNINTGEFHVSKFKGLEEAQVVQIKILGDETGEGEMNHVCFVLRLQRNPTIGDKFSSRHGQKGICSMLWPATDMPFSENGIVPDIIFNPHGFPSRMTIGMMIESMAGKAGASHGMYLDASPFTFSEDQPAIDYFGQMLTAGGYNYYGTERLYSGITGQEMEANIYIGIVYYQRLRHMVLDKFQVRTTGAVDHLTQQPVKGRKKGGGVRFGEMERDGLISHGASYLLQDRLFNCSDKSKFFICTACKNLLSPIFVTQTDDDGKSVNAKFRHQTVCRHCHRREEIEQIRIPYVFSYLVTELASVGIKVKLEVKPHK